jgi:hypothetical protein
MHQRAGEYGGAGADSGLGGHVQGRVPMNRTAPTGQKGRAEESLAELLGGRRGAVDATGPPVVFVAVWLAVDRSVTAAAIAAVAVAITVATWRYLHGHRPRGVLVGVLGTAVSALVALRTGRAEDFFLVQMTANAASALAWMVSVAFRWPLLGVIVGALLGQRARWREDPDLLRAYCRASWVWVAQYLIRVAVFTPLWWAGQVLALGVARIALSWPLVAACVAASWWVLRRVLPAEHPGLRAQRWSQAR